MDCFHRALLVAGLFLLAMTQSDGQSESQERERWRIKSPMRVKGGALSVEVLFLVLIP